MNCDEYLSSEMTFSVFGEELVQEADTVYQHFPTLEGEADLLSRRNFFTIVGVPFSDITADFVFLFCGLDKSVPSEFDITTWVLHLNRVVNKARTRELFP
jgi:hypothetical protein